MEKALHLEATEIEARVLASVILEYNEEAQRLARDDRPYYLSFADGRGGVVGLPIPERDKLLWRQMRRFRNLIVHGLLQFYSDGSISVHPSQEWRASKRDTDIDPFLNGLGEEIEDFYRYNLQSLRTIAGLFRGMSLRNRLQVSAKASSVCSSCGSLSQDVVGLKPDAVVEFPCGLSMVNSTGDVLSECAASL